MPLIVEDGTGLADADSYISLVDARTVADNYGYTLPDDDTEADRALRQGVGYVDLSESSLTGERLTTTQALAWPRSGAYKCLGNTRIDVMPNSVPSDIQRAQVVAASEYGAGNNPRGNQTGQTVTQETVGPITVKYADDGGSGSTYVVTEANDLLKPYKCGSTGLGLRTVRG